VHRGCMHRGGVLLPRRQHAHRGIVHWILEAATGPCHHTSVHCASALTLIHAMGVRFEQTAVLCGAV
jgi:hypothetical protein